ncbi:MAG: YafY family transcriptional regulator [Subtercola sp.]|nr:YafY family transcriptional regulator [Subtercola sp.]
MNRTDRLYAIVEQLRAVAPRPRSARWLAQRFEVSPRTIERDVSALQQSGTPIWAEPGRTGGYCLDAGRTLPPINFTPDEAVALTVGLRMLEDSPFRAAGLSALQKVVGAMHPADASSARELAERIHLLGDGHPVPGVPRNVAHALSTGHVLRIEYVDKSGGATRRDIEPLGYVGSAAHWYLLAWCRLRSGVRAFRVDRIGAVFVTAETPAPRTLSAADLEIPFGVLTRLDLD